MTRGVLALAAVAALWTAPAFAQTATVPQDVFLTTQGDGQYLAKDLLLGANLTAIKDRDEYLKKQAASQFAVSEADLVKAVRKVLARHKA